MQLAKARCLAHSRICAVHQNLDTAVADKSGALSQQATTNQGTWLDTTGELDVH